MRGKRRHPSGRAFWTLVNRQHGVIARRQLLALGYSRQAIEHRVTKKRLHPLFRGVYAVGRPDVTQKGMWMAAVLSCGPNAVLSHMSAAMLWGVRAIRPHVITLSVPAVGGRKKRRGIVVHRRTLQPTDVTKRDNIPVVSLACALVDLAAERTRGEVERAVGEADQKGLADPEKIRKALNRMTPRPGLKPLRDILDRHTFRLTRSELERIFIPIALSAGLPRPLTLQMVNGFEVDFYWPDLELVVETDSLRHHRTAIQQTKDLVRDQAHAVTDVTYLRFSHYQVAKERAYVRDRLAKVAARLSAQPARTPGRPRVP